MMNQEIESKRFPHDAIYKRFFAEKEIVQLFIQDYLPKYMTERLDLNTVKPYPTEFVSEKFQKSLCDRIWAVRLKDEDRYAYFILEFQSSIDKDMAFRLIEYKMAVGKNFPTWLTMKKDGKLPCVYTVVIYKGKEKWKAPIDASDLFRPISDKHSEHELKHKPIFIELCELEKEIEKKNDCLSRFFLLNIQESKEGQKVVFDKVVEEQKDNPKIKELFFAYMRKMLEYNGVDPKELEKIKTLEDLMKVFNDYPTWKENYIEQGIEQGIAQGIAQTLVLLLNDRFGNIPEALSTQIMSISDANQLSNLTLSAYKIASLSEFKTLLH